jgi:DNA repair exonuclease SbcCD ATPase subunit
MAREKVYSISHNECERTSLGALKHVLSEKCEVCGKPFIEEEKSFCRESYKQLDKIDQDILLDYVWETPEIIDTLKEWLNEDYTPNWSDRD